MNCESLRSIGTVFGGEKDGGKAERHCATATGAEKYINLIWNRLKQIHNTANTNVTPIPCLVQREMGKFRLPLTSAIKGKGEPSNWEKRCKAFAVTVKMNPTDPKR
jgi:hypothetical protein